MLFFNSDKRILLVVDKDYYPLVFTFKNEHPELNIKVISNTDLVDKVGYRYTEDIVPYLIKNKNIEYIKAKKLASLIPYLFNARENILSTYINELDEQGFLSRDEYGLKELSLYDIYLLEMDEDEGLKSLLNNNDITYHLIHLSDLDIGEINLFEEGISGVSINYFSNKFNQFSYILSDIRKKLIDDISLVNRIKILIKDDNDYFFIHSLAKLFGLEFYYVNETPLISIPSVSKLVESFYNDKKISIVPSEDPYIQIVNDLIDKYHLLDLDDDFAYSNLIEILSSQVSKEPTNDKGIIVTKQFTFRPDDIIYVTNFAYGSFYKEFDDNNFISDSLLKEIGLTTSYQKTALDRRKKLNYIKCNNIALLSRVKQHLSEAIYNSQFIDMFKLDDFIYNDNLNIDGCYTSEAKLLIDASQFDNQYYLYSIKDRYKTYDHSFKGVKANKLTIKNNKFHITDLERFYDCPFKYYIDKLIPLPSDLHHAFRGTLVHKVFEDILHDDYDFETAFEQGKQAYIQQMYRNNQSPSSKEEAYMEIYHHWLKNIVSILLETKEEMNLVQIKDDSELKINFEIGKYHFSGTIDKIIYTQYKDNFYYTIVDYKSGKEVFNSEILSVGKSIQLPLYYYAIVSQDDPSKYTHGYGFGGLFIQHNYFSSIKSGFVKNDVMSIRTLLENAKYDGVCLQKEEYWRSFDNTAFTTVDEVTSFSTEKALLVNGKNNTYKQFDSPVDESILIKPEYGLSRYNIDDIVKTSINAVLRIIDDIENNRFDIAPSSTEIQKHPDINKLSCMYCNHNNICYANKMMDMKDYYHFIRKTLIKEGH